MFDLAVWQGISRLVLLEVSEQLKNGVTCVVCVVNITVWHRTGRGISRLVLPEVSEQLKNGVTCVVCVVNITVWHRHQQTGVA